MTSPTLTRNSLTLILPAWNEAEVITQAIAEADAALRAVVVDYEIIVVDDGSDDGTADLVHEIAQSNPAVRLIQHDHNLGYGAALRTGFAEASFDLVAFTDADCQFDLCELDRLILLAKSFDAVCGYRIDRQDSWLRCSFSRVYNWIVRALLGIQVRDVDCALKVFRREILMKTDIQTDGFLVNSDLLTQITQNGGSIVEVGVTHRPRAAGESTVSTKHIPVVLVSLVRYWWNAIQFPSSNSQRPVQQDQADTSTAATQPRLGWMQVGLVILACLFLFTNLNYPLIDRDETRYAEIPREMLDAGNWSLPSLNFETYYDKPPMLYWLCAISYSIFGTCESSARLIPSMAALFTLVVTMWFANRHFGRMTGLLTGMVLMLSAGFAFSSRYLLLDGVLTFFVTMSMLLAYEAVMPQEPFQRKKPRLSFLLLASLFCAFGFLTKGPLSLVLMLPVLAGFSWLTADAAKPRGPHYLLILGVVGVVAAPWLIAVTLQDSKFLYEFFYRHNVQRFAGEFHDQPAWYFIPVLLVAGHPWSFLTIPLIHKLFSRASSARSFRQPLVGYLSLWSGWTFLFFSLSRCKLPTYLLPAAPAFALVIGYYLAHLFTQQAAGETWDRFASLWSARAATTTTCLIAIGVIAYAAATTMTTVAACVFWGILWAILLVGSVLVFGRQRRSEAAWITAAVVTSVCVFMLMHQFVPAYSRTHTLFAPGYSIADELEFSTKGPIATVNHEFSEVPFYLARRDVRNFKMRNATELSRFVSEHGESLIIADQNVLVGELRKAMPDGILLQYVGRRGATQIVHASLPKHYVEPMTAQAGKSAVTR